MDFYDSYTDGVKYKVSTTEHKMIQERERWKCGDKQFYVIRTFETGYVIVDREPDLTFYDEDEGTEIDDFENQDFGTHDYSFEIIEGISLKELTELIKIHEEEFDDGLEDFGYRLKEIETWFKGKLLVEEYQD